ncbi:MAG TPA: Maf family protein [Novimethylophilus sp.]|jgi:septum formation protein|uniref:Maf family protein n=1 Tax=Novimethylophilus sp. TaxID=2137426 RepID=UPI002F417F56
MTLKIYLASRSPRRGELLRQIGVAFDVLPSDVDESVHPGEAPEHYVLRLAREKAEACAERIAADGLPDLPILAADTTVCADGEILGKPERDEDACAMLRRMSDRWHTVHTGIALAHRGRIEVAISSTQVEVAPLSAAEIAAYVASGEPRDKAGGYGIQGLAGAFIRRIEGSFSGVMGLPVYETAQLLKKSGLNVL